MMMMLTRRRLLRTAVTYHRESCIANKVASYPNSYRLPRWHFLTQKRWIQLSKNGCDTQIFILKRTSVGLAFSFSNALCFAACAAVFGIYLECETDARTKRETPKGMRKNALLFPPTPLIFSWVPWTRLEYNHACCGEKCTPKLYRQTSFDRIHWISLFNNEKRLFILTAR